MSKLTKEQIVEELLAVTTGNENSWWYTTIV